MSGEWLMQWWNLIFIVPFGLALLYLGVYAMSGFTFGDADGDVGVDGANGRDGGSGAVPPRATARRPA